MNEHTLSWETLEREQAFACEAFEVFTDRVRLPGGAETRFDFVSEPPSAVVLPVTEQGDIVVIEEYRHAVDRVALGLPGGSAEPDDIDLAATAVRELLEEAGYHAGELEKLAVTEPANGLLSSERHFFKATGCEPAAETDRDIDESIQVRTMSPETLFEQVVTGEVIDERTIVAVLMDRCGSDTTPPSVDTIS